MGFTLAKQMLAKQALAKQVLAKQAHLQSVLLCLFWRWGLRSYLVRLASNNDSPDISLPSSLKSQA
jgi:hypothetical protein